MALPSLTEGRFAALWDREGLGPPPFPITARTDIGSPPTTDLLEAMRVMARADKAFRTHYATHSGRTDAVFYATPSGRTLRAVQRRGEIQLGWLHTRRVADGFLELLPDTGPGAGRAFQVPEHAVAAARRAWRVSGLRADGVRLLIATGVGHDRAERVLSALGETTGTGDAGFAFADTPTGRYALRRGYGSHTVIPLDRPTMAAWIRFEMAC